MVNPLKAFGEMPTKKKVAVGVATAGVVALGVASYLKGKKTDAFVNSTKEGAKKLNVFKTMWAGLKSMATSVVDSLKKLVKKSDKADEKAAEKTAEVVDKTVNTVA